MQCVSNRFVIAMNAAPPNRKYLDEESCRVVRRLLVEHQLWSSMWQNCQSSSIRVPQLLVGDRNSVARGQSHKEDNIPDYTDVRTWLRFSVSMVAEYRDVGTWLRFATNMAAFATSPHPAIAELD